MRFPISILYLVISTTVHVIAAKWLLARTPLLRKQPMRAGLVGLVALLSVLPSAARLMTWVTSSSTFVVLLAAAVLEMFAAIVAVLLVALVTLGRRGLARARRRRATEVATPAPEPAPRPAVLARRQALERFAGLGLYGAAGGTFAWGMKRGRLDFVTEEVVVAVPGWPKALDGYVIAQVSDIHVGAFIGDVELERGFELVRRAKPDLVVATGDLVDFLAESADPLARFLRSVPARDGAVAIVGNHDHYAGPEEVITRLRAGGVRVLHNEGLVLRPRDGGGFALLGVDDLQGRRAPQPGFAGPDLARALAQVPADLPRILLAHQPNFFRESAGRVALQLSGHTHGGQIRPLTTPVTTFWEFVRGRYERQGSALWVNRGFGTSGPPSRVGAPPEITRIVLVSA